MDKAVPGFVNVDQGYKFGNSTTLGALNMGFRESMSHLCHMLNFTL